MFIKLGLALVCFLMFVAEDCGSKSNGNNNRATTSASGATTASPAPSSSAVNNSAPTSAPPAAPLNEAAATQSFDACALIEKAEVASAQGKEVSDAKSSRRDDDQFVSSQCFYVASPYDYSVSLEVTERNPKQVDTNVVKKFWAQRFESARVTKKKDLPRAVPGVGDKAYWVGNDRFGALYAMQGDKMLRISVGGAGNADAKIEKSKLLAEKALKRLG